MVARAAVAKSGDPDAMQAAEAEERRVVSMNGWLSQRLGRRSTPFGAGYDPPTGLRYR
jgi:hypothetical protein